jgi:hypothetical protein
MTVVLEGMSPAQEQGWLVLLDLFPNRRTDWTLIGGQMMYILAAENGVTMPRTTTDMDVVINVADQLARPQGISVDDLIRAGVATYPKPGFVGLLGAGDMDRGWKPSIDSRPTAWEALHHLADRLIDGGGELEAGRLMGELAVLRDPAQALVYRLYDIAAKTGRTKDQERYNALIGSWADLLVVAGQKRDGELF